MSYEHYFEGTVISREGRTIYVEWYDGSRERLYGAAADAIQHLPNGTLFGAHCVLPDLGEGVVSIYKVAVI